MEIILTNAPAAHASSPTTKTAETMSDSDEYDEDSSQDEEVNENMKVFLRLRPMNKLETSRRSKNCVDLPEDDPRCLTVDSPLEGEYDFFFDRVS